MATSDGLIISLMAYHAEAGLDIEHCLKVSIQAGKSEALPSEKTKIITIFIVVL